MHRLTVLRHIAGGSEVLQFGLIIQRESYTICHLIFKKNVTPRGRRYEVTIGTSL